MFSAMFSAMFSRVDGKRRAVALQHALPSLCQRVLGLEPWCDRRTRLEPGPGSQVGQQVPALQEGEPSASHRAHTGGRLPSRGRVRFTQHGPRR